MCYNVTPKMIADEYGFNIFKFDMSCNSFLLYDNEIYPMGNYFGGLGATSFAIADINADNKNELYFTYSWGSGMHRSQVGYFDTANSKITIFDFQNFNKDSILMVDNKNILSIYNANCNITSFVDIEMTAESQSKVASIILNSGKITFIQEVN